MKCFPSVILFFFIIYIFFALSHVDADKLDELLFKHRSYCGRTLNDPAYDLELEDEPIVIEFSTTNPFATTTTTPTPTTTSQLLTSGSKIENDFLTTIPDSSTPSSSKSSSSSSSFTTSLPNLRNWFDYITGRIVGGVRAGKNEFPWQISIRKFSGKYNKWYHACGGSIIDNQWIITAAHCVLSGNNTDLYKIRVGEYDYSKDDGDERDYNVSKILMNRAFTMASLEPDVALIKLTEPIELSVERKIVPICVANDMKPERGEGPSARNCISTGWGRNRYVVGRMMSVLQKVEVPLVPLEKCKDRYDGVAKITTSMICSGSEGHATCEGDSGGPLQCMEANIQQGGNETFHLYGLTSFAVGCATARFPSVNCRVSKFRDWIADKMINEIDE